MAITSDSLVRKIKRMERIADHEDGSLEVYLAETDSVTIEVIHGLARTLRDPSATTS